MLVVLAMRKDIVVSRGELLESIYGHEVSGYENSISVLINRVRSKIEPNPSEPQYVHTVRGVGYKFGE